MKSIYFQTSNRHRIPQLKRFLSHLAVVFAQSIEARGYDENEDVVVGAAPTGDAPTTSEISTILLPVKVASYIRGLMLIWYVKIS